MVKLKRSKGDWVFDSINMALCIIIMVLVAYPLIYIISASFSDPLAVLQGKMVLYPVGFSFDSYVKVFNHEDILTGYKNSLILVIIGTVINFTMTLLAAYPLSRKDLYGRNIITMFFAFTMFFGGGMIPTYLVVQNLGLLDSIWSLIIPSAVSMYNLIVMRTFFQTSIPD